jgi:hypothetical protein
MACEFQQFHLADLQAQQLEMIRHRRVVGQGLREGRPGL